MDWLSRRRDRQELESVIRAAVATATESVPDNKVIIIAKLVINVNLAQGGGAKVVITAGGDYKETC